MVNYIQILENIHKHCHPHFVLCGEDKRPISKWKDFKPSVTDVVDHIERDGRVGVIPSTVGSFVVDADYDKQKHMASDRDITRLNLGATPFHKAKSKTRGSYHHWFTCDLKNDYTKKHDWDLGDFIYSGGYVILWHPDSTLTAILDSLQHPREKHTIKRFPQLFEQAVTSTNGRSDYREGNRNNSLNRDSFKAGIENNKGILEDAMSKALASGLPENEVISTATSGFNAGCKNKDEAKAKKPDKREKTRERLISELQTIGVQIRKCGLKNTGQFKKDDGPWVNFSDEEVNGIRADILLETGTNWSSELFYDRASAIFRDCTVNSFKVDYLDTLPKWEKWMVKSDYLFPLALGAENTPLNREIGRMLIQAIVERAYLPCDTHDEHGNEINGIKFDYFPILVGPEQGEGKTTFCEHLIPFPSMYGNRFDLGEKTVEQQESVRGKVVIESTELIGLSPKKADAINGFLSLRYEPQHRKKWAKNEVQPVRRCVFIGTTNDENPIPLTGNRNRRMYPIVVNSDNAGNVRKWLVENRDQVFAHGIHCKNLDKPLYLPKWLEEEQEKIVRKFTNCDEDMEDSIREFCGTLKQNWFQLEDLIIHLFCADAQDAKTIKDTVHRQKNPIADMLKTFRFTVKRCKPDGALKRARYWFYPCSFVHEVQD